MKVKGIVKVTSLREEIIAFREQLNSPNKPDFSWGHTPLLDFEDKENYPLDFQIFMEEIGTMYASCTFNEGYSILHLEVPVTIESPSENSPIAFDYKKNEIVYENNGESYSAHEVSIAAIDVDRQEYGFNLTKKPYEFFSIWGVDWAGDSTVGISFWSWFKKHMIDSIKYL